MRIRPYIESKDFDEMINWITEERTHVFDISEYDTVFIMSPIYWGTYAPEIETALEGLDFGGKKIRIICTHEGSGLSGMPADVKKMCTGADVDVKGLAIRGSQAKESKDMVKAWL